MPKKLYFITSKPTLFILEHPHQYVQKNFHFKHIKPTFSILHSHFYKTPISVCLLYTFIQIKYSIQTHHQPTHPAAEEEVVQ